MTTLIATEHDNDKGRSKIMAIANIDYKRFFNDYERDLLQKLSIKI